jgi:hypothetical protein
MTQLLWLNLVKAAGVAQKTAGDLALGAAGICLAGSSIGFAAYMISTSDQGPRINAADKLGIFAQPVSTPYNGGSGRSAGGPEFDLTPVSSVRKRPPPAPVPAEKHVSGYYMRGYSQGEALVQGPDGFIAARVGATIEGVGVVTAIEARGRSLVVVTTAGIIAGDD